MTNSFFYQKGPIITRERWEFPSKKSVDNFFRAYIPEFLCIFGGDRNYELYFFGSSRDRLLGYTQTYTPEHSYDVDIIITTRSQPDTQKIYEAMTKAVKVGFENKLLIDIQTIEKTYYFEYEDFMYHDINHFLESYCLNPVIKIDNDFFFEKYIGGKKDFMLKTFRKEHSPKLLDKIYKGWIAYKPTKII